METKSTSGDTNPREGKKPKKSEGKKKDRRSWTDNEKDQTLEYLISTIKAGYQIEKPNAHAYYAAALNKLKFADCTPSQLQNQVYNLKKKYTTAIDWRNKTGQGVLIENGEASVIGTCLNK